MPFLWSKLGLNKPIFGLSLAIASLIVVIRQVGGLEGVELAAYDGLVRLQPDRGADPRLLVVAITEEDFRNLGKSPPIDDRTLDKVLNNIAKHQPRAIGLDIYRDLPVEPGHIELETNLQVSTDLVPICNARDNIAPPPSVPSSRLGFSDVVLDGDRVVRRNLLFITPNPESKCLANYSLGTQLARFYLEKQGIKWERTAQEELKVGSVLFQPIVNDTGAYRNVDARGYQILLQYRSPNTVARQVTLTEVLQDKIDPNLVKDRIVLIGTTAASSNDFFYTPYSAGGKEDLRIPGVMVHAQMASQILSVVLDGQPLIWSWNLGIVALWVWGWCLIGAILAWYLRRPWLLAISSIVTIVGLAGICYLVFGIGGWIPLVPPIIGLVGTAIATISYKIYHSSRSTPSLPTTQAPLPVNQPFLGSLLKVRYKILEKLSHGGFGWTYLAEDTQQPSHPQCVVKHLKPLRDDPEFMEVARRLFYAEAETLEFVGKHPQIPQLMAYFEQEGEFYLVQEFIKGHPLSKEIILGRCLSESYVVALLKNVLPILEFVHTHHVIHRDIKPANLLRRQADGKLVLIDFGAVKNLQNELSTGKNNYTVPIFTQGYAPPEQILGNPVINSDIYALGMLAIQALTGSLPTDIVKDEVRKVVMWREAVNVEVSDRLAAILDRMVRFEASDRYQSATDVLQALQDLG
jgi:CHASE2 domain-containing sensor protein